MILAVMFHCKIQLAVATRPFLPQSLAGVSSSKPLADKAHILKNWPTGVPLVHRGGSLSSMSLDDKANGSSPSTANPSPLDLTTWSRMRVNSDPSSIPIAALLSKRYLDVPIDSESNSMQPLGLTDDERLHRLKHVYGPNELEQPPERTLLSFIFEQFDDKLVRILLVVACASAFFGMLELKTEIAQYGNRMLQRVYDVIGRSQLGNAQSTSTVAAQVIEEARSKIVGAQSGEYLDEATIKTFGLKQIMEALVEPIIITTILVINALVGGYQSLNATKGISALKKMQAQKAVVRIYHEGTALSPKGTIDEVEVDASSLVPGDVVVLSVGQKIPADIRLVSVSTSTFTVDEACLTGESDSVSKMPYKGEVIEGDLDHRGHIIDDLDEIQEEVGSMGKHANGMLYSGTVITAGKGVGVVVRTGMTTEMGKVSHAIFLLRTQANFVLHVVNLIANLIFFRSSEVSRRQLRTKMHTEHHSLSNLMNLVTL